MSRFTNSLARRRAELKDREGGFTLVELLVVVIIIGILAAIAIPIYIGIQDGAKDAGVKSDLTNAKTAVISYYVDNTSGTPNLTDGSLDDYGLTTSEYLDGDLSFVTSPTDSSDPFCIKGKSKSGTEFQIKDDEGVSKGDCS